MDPQQQRDRAALGAIEQQRRRASHERQVAAFRPYALAALRRGELKRKLRLKAAGKASA